MILRKSYLKSIIQVDYLSFLMLILALVIEEIILGEGEMVAKVVWEYNKAGAAGLHIEDQVFPKRCGHLDGKALINANDMVSKIRIASKASIECSDG